MGGHRQVVSDGQTDPGRTARRVSWPLPALKRSQGMAGTVFDAEEGSFRAAEACKAGYLWARDGRAQLQREKAAC